MGFNWDAAERELPILEQLVWELFVTESRTALHMNKMWRHRQMKNLEPWKGQEDRIPQLLAALKENRAIAWKLTGPTISAACQAIKDEMGEPFGPYDRDSSKDKEDSDYEDGLYWGASYNRLWVLARQDRRNKRLAGLEMAKLREQDKWYEYQRGLERIEGNGEADRITDV